MDCPKCLGKLQPRVLDGIEIDVCYLCEGIWFDKGELEKILKAQSRLIPVLPQVSGMVKEKIRSASLDQKKGTCPRYEGSVMLEQEKYKGILVDVCPYGHGVWLDTDELRKLVINILKLKYRFFWGVIFIGLSLFFYFTLIPLVGRLLCSNSSFKGGRSGGAGSSADW